MQLAPPGLAQVRQQVQQLVDGPAHQRARRALSTPRCATAVQCRVAEAATSKDDVDATVDAAPESFQL